MLEKVTISKAMKEFEQYRKGNSISTDQFKTSMKTLILMASSDAEISENDLLRINTTTKRLIKLFDTNKNGKLEFTEAVSALCVLCGGAVQGKIKYLLGAYSERGGLTIKFKNLKKFIESVLKLALKSSNEIMLDYPLPDLAKATA